MSAEIWISYYNNSTGGSEAFMTNDWKDAKNKSYQLINNDIILCETKIAGKILAELVTDNWRKAVELFNKSNYRNNDIRFFTKNPYREL